MGDVLVVSPVRQLVDTALREAIESLGTTVAGNDALRTVKALRAQAQADHVVFEDGVTQPGGGGRRR